MSPRRPDHSIVTAFKAIRFSGSEEGIEMPGHDIVVIGASAGGVEALSQLAHLLPGDFPGSIFVVLHLPAHGPSLMPQILTRRGKLPAAHPSDGEEILPGRIAIAPPDQNLLLEDGRMRLVRGPRENGHRPAVDPLFRSAALAYGRRVVGVVLSGTLDDGAAGLAAIKQRGGIAIVQDPSDAIYPGMPAAPSRRWMSTSCSHWPRSPGCWTVWPASRSPSRRIPRCRKIWNPKPRWWPSTWVPSRTRTAPASRRHSPARTAAGRSGSCTTAT